MDSSMNSMFKHLIFKLVILFIAGCILTASVIVWIGLSDNTHTCDVAVILGNQIHRNGQPYARLAARLDKGIELYRQSYFSHIIVSGGKEKNGFDEATVMKNYLVAHHIPESAIIKDSHGSDTEKTAINTQFIMHKYGYKSAMVISQYFHIARTKLAFKRCGISPVYNAHANYFELRDLYSICREVPAFYDYYFLRKFKLR
jgi:vancomycin permeability regulator SanA